MLPKSESGRATEQEQPSPTSTAKRDRRICAEARCPLASSPDRDLCGKCAGPMPRGSRPRSCHSCKWADKANAICLTCPGPAEGSNEGQSWVHYDSAPAPDELLQNERDDLATTSASNAPDPYDSYATRDEAEYERARETVTASLSAETEDALRVVLAQLSELDPTDRELFFSVYNGADRATAARNAGMSKQAAGYRFTRIAKRHPQLGSFLAGILKSRDGIGGGANAGKRKGGFTQMAMNF